QPNSICGREVSSENKGRYSCQTADRTRRRMVRCATDVRYVLTLEPFRQICRDVAGAVVGEKPWPVDDLRLAEPRGLQGQVFPNTQVAAIRFLGWGLAPIWAFAEWPKARSSAGVRRSRTRILLENYELRRVSPKTSLIEGDILIKLDKAYKDESETRLTTSKL